MEPMCLENVSLVDPHFSEHAMAKRRRKSNSSSRSRKSSKSARAPLEKIRYAVVGLGHIAQAAVLPAFRHASRNSELVALVSDHPQKLKVLGRRYRVGHLCGYDDFDTLLAD